jgi:hypothetical protein
MCIPKIRQLDNTLNNVSRVVLRRRIWRIFRRRGITERAVTHQLQRTRKDTEIIKGWSEYINDKTRLLKIGPENVCNFSTRPTFTSRPKANVLWPARGTRQSPHLGQTRCNVAPSCSELLRTGSSSPLISSIRG